MYDTVVYPVRGVRDELQTANRSWAMFSLGSTSRSLFFVVTCPPQFSHCREFIRLETSGHWVLIVTHITPVTVVSNATLSFYWSLNHFDVHDNIPYLHQSTCLCLEESTRQSSVQLDAYGR